MHTRDLTLYVSWLLWASNSWIAQSQDPLQDVASSEARLQYHAVEAMKLPLRYGVNLLLLFLPRQRSALPFPCNCKKASCTVVPQLNKGVELQSTRVVTQQSPDRSLGRWMVLRLDDSQGKHRLCTSRALAVMSDR